MSEQLWTAAELACQLDDTDASTVRDQLARLGNANPEVGHAIADDLAQHALRLIAQGHPNPANLAANVLTVLSADFPRWHA